MSFPANASSSELLAALTPKNPLLLMTLSGFAAVPSPPPRTRRPFSMLIPKRLLLETVTPPSRLKVPPWAAMPLRTLFWIVKLNTSTTELSDCIPKPPLVVIDPSPIKMFELLLMRIPRPALKLTPSMKTFTELVMFITRPVGMLPMTVTVPGLAKICRSLKPTIRRCSEQVEGRTLMELGPVFGNESRAAWIVVNAPGVAPLQSTLALLAKTRLDVNINITRHTTNRGRERQTFITRSPCAIKFWGVGRKAPLHSAEGADWIPSGTSWGKRFSGGEILRVLAHFSH